MLGYISGTIKAIRKNYIIVATDYLGYKIFVIPQVSLSLEPAQKVSFYIYTHVREDQLSLYGFSTLPEQEFFELLLGISGIGPKMALSIMSIANLEMIKSAIANQDAGVFTKISGIGLKTAERLILELKDKIGEYADKDDFKDVSQMHADVIDVLLALGYSRSEARKALAELPKDLTNADDKIRIALRSLAKQ
ncbi:MAG: Holliday junction branch migration protein RuvA [bacterium]|nr:Holliday junction branch migration protein RuvA [bacterium]